MKKPLVMIFFVVLFLAFQGIERISADNHPDLRGSSYDYGLDYPSPSRIDPEAAYAERETPRGEEKNILVHCPDPQSMLLVIFGAYIFLLVFNFSFAFEKQKTPQWFWEALYTALAFYAWKNLDKCATDFWFPVAVIESWLVIFGFYLYIFFRVKFRND